MNTNSIMNKFEILSKQVRSIIEKLNLMSVSLLEMSSLIRLVHHIDYISGLYCDSKGGGLIFYIREDISSKLLATKNSPIEIHPWKVFVWY